MREIAPEPPDALTEQHERRGYVEELGQRYFGVLHQLLPEQHSEHYARRRSDQTAYDAQSDIAVTAAARGDVIQHRAAERAGHREDYVVEHYVGVISLFERGIYPGHYTEYDGDGDDISVPVHRAGVVLVHILGEYFIDRERDEHESHERDRRHDRKQYYQKPLRERALRKGREKSLLSALRRLKVQYIICRRDCQ